MTEASGGTDAVAASLALFDAQGFESTSVEQIADAAGMSRSTFFRHFGGKDDVVFADHEVLLERVRAFLDAAEGSPWQAVCDASLLVFAHFAADPELARLRYRVVRDVPALRDREIVTASRYERAFDGYLRRALPGVAGVDAVGFAATVTAVHNHVLRRLLRGTDAVEVAALRAALDDVLRRYGVHPDGAATPDDEVVVAVFPRRMPSAELTRRLRESLD